MTIQFLPQFKRMLEADAAIKAMHAKEALRREREYRPGDEDYWYRLAHGLDWRSDVQEGIRAAATPATANFTQMAKVVGNTGGQIQSLPGVNVVSGRQRTWIDTLTLASQASGTVFGVARLPLYATLLAIELLTDTSLATATIKFGDAGNANSAIYAAAQTLTSTNTIVRTATAGTKGTPITAGFDSVTGLAMSPFMPQLVGEGGAVYEDIIMTTGVAALPASGTLIVMIEYLSPDS